MELLIALAMKFWQWSLLILIVIIGFCINLLDKKKKPKQKFNYTGMPHIKPLPIILHPLEHQVPPVWINFCPNHF